MKMFKTIMKRYPYIQSYPFVHIILCIKKQNYMYKYLFKNYFKYFSNLKIILSMSDNFKDVIVTLV